MPGNLSNSADNPNNTADHQSPNLALKDTSNRDPRTLSNVLESYQTVPQILDTVVGREGTGIVQVASSPVLSAGKSIKSKAEESITGTTVLVGTVVGNVINTSAAASGEAFQPVTSGLQAIKGLENLGEGLSCVDGIPVTAIRQVGTLTLKAMNMSGITPTFFDTDADGVVRVEHTIKGLIILGLQKDQAKYAAYALHIIFSYSTSDSWIPSRDITLPVNVRKMNSTRWGKNWGTYERIDWCKDIDIETFFRSSESTGIKRWKETVKKSRQNFGVLLLIFEWGTTWPFYMPVDNVAYQDDIGKVIRAIILPTIRANFQIAHTIKPREGEASSSSSG